MYTNHFPLSFLFSIALNCPEGTVYDPCGSQCPDTCGDMENSANCTDATCIETCRCPDDQVLDGNHCVNPDDCGCTWENGMYYPVSLKIT